MNPTPKGRVVRSRTVRICARSHAAPPTVVPPIKPKPPAAETAAASSAAALPAIGALAVGTALVAGPVGSLALFAAYRLGLGLVLTAVALGAALVRGVVSTTLRRALPYVQQVSALLLVVAGGYLLWTDLLHLLS